MLRTYQVVFAINSKRPAPSNVTITKMLDNEPLATGENLTKIDTISYIKDNDKLEFDIYTCAITWTYTSRFTLRLTYEDYELFVMANADDVGYDHVQEHYAKSNTAYPFQGSTQSLAMMVMPKSGYSSWGGFLGNSHFECMTMFI